MKAKKYFYYESYFFFLFYKGHSKGQPLFIVFIPYFDTIDLLLRHYMFTFLRFSAIGILNTLVDFGIFNLLIISLGLSANDAPRYALFKSISFVVAVINSFFLNKQWVFRHSADTKLHEIGKFFAINLVGLGINAIIGSFVFKISSDHPLLTPHGWANVAALCSIGITFIFNFFCYKFIVFKSS